MNHEGLEVKSYDHEKLATALGTIAEVLIGKELESVRNSTAGLESKLSSCVESLKEASTRAMDEMLAKLTEAEKSRGKVVAELETRIDQLQAQMLVVQEELAKNDVESVSQNVAVLQEKLQRQQANTERISTTLGSLANVLSGAPHNQASVSQLAVPEPLPEPVPVEAIADAPPVEPTQPAAVAEAVSDATASGEIDNVLERAFGGD